MKYLMAIDAGTGSIRAVIFDKDGNQISVSQREWSHIAEENIPDSMTFQIDKNWILVKECIKKALSKADLSGSDISAISATSMREGIVLYDKEGHELWAVANVDARAGDEVRYLKERYPDIEKEFYALSGQTFALGALPRILWLKNNKPDIYARIANISMISDWILAKLSGVIATDPSNGGTTGIFSLSSRQWLADMAEKIDIVSDIFPPVLETGTSMGHIIDTSFGLSSDTMVVMGGGDVQLGAAGLGVTRLGQVAILGGSFWQQVVNIPSDTPPPSDMSIRVNPHVIRDLSQAEGITFFSGLIMRWFRDAFCDLEKQNASARGVDTYQVLEEMANSIPVGSHGIMPIFSDSMKYGKWYHAAPSFINLSIDSDICNKASMFRSLEENACIVSAINLDKIKEFTGLSFTTIVFAGGASKGGLWCQILADVTGCRVKVPKVTEATALGASMAAGVGVGIYKDMQSASDELVAWDKVYDPNMNNHEKYKTIKERWQEIYQQQLRLVDAGLTTSMWQAPGI